MIALWERVDPQFLAVLGWDPEMRVLTFPQAHPLLGWPVCSVAECGKIRKDSGGLCASCARNWQLEGEPALPEFVQRPRTRRRCVGVGRCAVRGCERPWVTGGIALCSTHRYQRVTVFKVSPEEFLAHPDVVPLPAFGDCHVAACVRDRPGNGPYCHSHSVRWRDEKRRHPDLDEQHWRRTVPAVATNSEVSLRGLAPLVVAEVVYGLQERTKQGIKTTYTLVRPLCDISRRLQVSSLRDIPKGDLSKPYEGLRNGLGTSASQVGLNPETERHKDIWQAVAFGHSGTLRFTEISQPWLRDAAKRWAFDDLPQRRGAGVRNVVQSRINSLAELSTSLRLQRGDHGNHVGALGREDITTFCNRLAYLAGQGAISQAKRLVHCRLVRHVLGAMREMGLTGDGKPLHGLADEFALGTSDIPDEPEDAEAGKDLPIEVMRHLCAHVTVFDTMGRPEIRVATELLIDTGRRPDEICQLGLDCLDRDTDGKPVLVYDNHKNQRLGRRLPIPEATAALIVEQQDRVRAQFPDTPAAALKLLPSPTRNPQGRKAITHGWVSQRHREWVERLPEVTVPAVVEVDGERVTKLLPFDKARIFPYAYRHTYAQRHAYAGVPVDVLRDLMDHRQLATTQGYYRVGEERRREASTGSPRCSSTGTATGSGARPRHCWTPNTPAGRSVRSLSPTAAAPSPATSPQAATTARSASAASVADTSTPTCPTSPTWRPTSGTSCATGNACSRPSTPMTGPRPRPHPQTRRSSGSAG